MSNELKTLIIVGVRKTSDLKQLQMNVRTVNYEIKVASSEDVNKTYYVLKAK